MRFVFIKATQGTMLVDSRFAANVRRAREAGLLAGAYHFFDYTKDGTAQADHLVDTAAAQGMLTDAMPLVIDVECWKAFGWAVWAETVPRLRAMVDRVVERTGRPPIVYTSRQMWKQVMGGDRTFGDLPLWVACWRCDRVLLPAGWSRWRFWQIRPYRFPELGKTLDGNVFNGTDTSLETWRGFPVLINDGARMTAERLVALDVSTFDGAHLRTADDRGDWSDWRPWAASVEHRLTEGDGEREVRVQIRSSEGAEGPELNDRILLDQSGPHLGRPVLTLRDGPLGTDRSIPVQVTWTAQDPIAGVASSMLVHDCGPGLGGEHPAAAARTRARTRAADRATAAARAGTANRATTADRPTVRRRIVVAGDAATLISGSVPPGICGLSVRGVDTLGNRTDPGSPVILGTTITDQSGLAIAAGTAWVTRTQAGSVDGSVVRTSTSGASLTFRVQGDQVAIVATKGPSRGRLTVLLDGASVATADLYSAVKTPRSVVAVVSLPDAAPHRLRLTVMRTTNPLSKGRRVDLDAVVTAVATSPWIQASDPRTRSD